MDEEDDSEEMPDCDQQLAEQSLLFAYAVHWSSRSPESCLRQLYNDSGMVLLLVGMRASCRNPGGQAFSAKCLAFELGRFAYVLALEDDGLNYDEEEEEHFLPLGPDEAKETPAHVNLIADEEKCEETPVNPIADEEKCEETPADPIADEGKCEETPVDPIANEEKCEETPVDPIANEEKGGESAIEPIDVNVAGEPLNPSEAFPIQSPPSPPHSQRMQSPVQLRAASLPNPCPLD